MSWSESAVATPATVEATIARFVRKTSFSLDVVTREGDTVSLRVRSRQAMSYGAAAAAWADASVTKNCIPFVSGPRLAMQSRPARSCLAPSQSSSAMT